MRKPITRCPHCGSDEGVYMKSTYVNVPFRIGFMGEEQDNGEMYDNTEKITGGELVYCQSCDKIICRTSTMRKQWANSGQS